jgi:hypothetical protein
MFSPLRLEWLATGGGSPWETPGVEGEIDSTTRAVVHHLTDPEEREFTAWYEAQITETKFLGPLKGTMIDHVLSAFTDALDERRSLQEMQPMEIIDWKKRELGVVLALDQILLKAWEGGLGLVGRELAIEPGHLTTDQQIRFAHEMILAILALLPERDLPVAS